ncbi:MAG: sulfate ABC transporter ATP-binding protein, partial [Burkholderiaceae bacterium]
HAGLAHLQGMQIEVPEHAQADNAKAYAYVRPHEFDVQRYAPGAEPADAGRTRGIVAQLERAIVVGPIARLELVPSDEHQAVQNTPPGAQPQHVIEAQIPAQQFHDMGLREGEALLLTPRRARVFLEEAAGI